MSDLRPIEIDFLTKITDIVTQNIANDQFGVAGLATEAGMSRSNLLRKVKKLTGLSVSQFIRKIRLGKAVDLLQNGELTVSEVSFEVGFSSTSYFIKCFRDQYGFPPGEVGKGRAFIENNDSISKSNKKKIIPIWALGVALVVVLALLAIILNPTAETDITLEKSIVVLPFKNDSNDSTNVYLINGVMESLLANLQKIENLRVISRTSAEKYRNSSKSIDEIARELNVNYFVEGSGQKVGDQILLNIQLIEAPSDNQLWAGQYNRKVTDIFQLQLDIAKKVADEIQVFIKPEEAEQINKIPTDDLVAYDYFLKGLDLFYQGTREGLQAAIPFFEKAIEQDPQFARAHADIAIAYYLLDVNQAEKKYSSQINNYADKALLLDDKLPQSLMAKAFFYVHSGEYELAVPYLEKALEYNPNSSLVINTLSDFYASYLPNTEKYLEYALKGVRLDIAAHDSITASYIFLHLSNALVQSGFVDEAKTYIDKSLAYNPANLYSEYVKAYILFAQNHDLLKTKQLLQQALNKDSTRLDILQEVGKIHYYLRDFEGAYSYFHRFIESRNAFHLDIYNGENAKMAVVLDEVGMKEKSEKLMQDYFEYAQNDESIYKHLSLTVYHSYRGETEKALEHFRLFTQQDNFHYWTILFLKMDPLVDNIKDLPEFRKLYQQMEEKFWKYHRQIQKTLKTKALI